MFNFDDNCKYFVSSNDYTRKILEILNLQEKTTIINKLITLIKARYIVYYYKNCDIILNNYIFCEIKQSITGQINNLNEIPNEYYDFITLYNYSQLQQKNNTIQYIHAESIINKCDFDTSNTYIANEKNIDNTNLYIKITKKFYYDYNKICEDIKNDNLDLTSYELIYNLKYDKKIKIFNNPNHINMSSLISPKEINKLTKLSKILDISFPLSINTISLYTLLNNIEKKMFLTQNSIINFTNYTSFAHHKQILSLPKPLHFDTVYSKYVKFLIHIKIKFNKKMATEAYCVKCKAKSNMKDEKQVEMNGKGGTKRNAMTGTCEKCGTKMFKIMLLLTSKEA